MRGKRKALVTAGLAALAATAATTAVTPASGSPQQSGSVKIGIVYSQTGLLSAYGQQYLEAFKLGLAYATKGTNKVAGRKLEISYADDAGDPARAVSAAKDMIGKGAKIIAGSTSSGVALQVAPLAAQNRVLFISGPAATDAVTGLNRYTFRSGRQSFQDVAVVKRLVSKVPKDIQVFAQDSAFGQSNVAAVQGILGPGGHKVRRLLVPLTANDFTPFASQVSDDSPDLLFVAWAGTTAPAMWNALDQQEVFNKTAIVTGLAERATWPTFGRLGTRLTFLSHYVANGPVKNNANTYLIAQLKKRKKQPDLFSPDGFNAALMIVRAVSKGGDNVDRMISALEGWKFTGPKGPSEIRKADHALLQPMFWVRLKKVKGQFQPEVVQRLAAKDTAPPAKTFPR